MKASRLALALLACGLAGEAMGQETLQIRHESPPASHSAAPASQTPPSAGQLGHAVLDSPAWQPRYQAIHELARRPPAEATEGLELALATPEPALRREIAQALGQAYGETPPVLLGQMLLGDPDEQVRAAALRALAELDTEIARQFIRQALRDPEPFIRTLAQETLARLAPP
ncbi:MAG: HEAT repeat domain-containing protein [Pseudomonadota bacterium]